MLRHLTAACLAALFVLNAVSPRAAAKPPDLPDDEPIIVTEAVDTPKVQGVCPRCADRRALTEGDPKTMPSVLENLRMLTKAAAEIDLARKLAASGKVMEAISHLDEARKLCPGSSYARRAEEVMKEIGGARVHELVISNDVLGPATVETPCCETLNRIRNIGACYMARIGTYGTKVQEAARQRAQILSATYDGGGIGGKLDGCESACPKCEKMHRAVMKRAGQKAAGIKEQVNGLLKACYFAVQEGRKAKAADLARQAHALDPKRVEADPLVYKLHMLAEKGQCEECETPRESSPTCPKCPTDPVEDHVSLRPALPAVDPEIVTALGLVLVNRGGVERVGIDFGSAGEECEEAEGCCCCSCGAVVEAIGVNLVGMFLNLPPMDCDREGLMFGFDSHGINGHGMAKHAGMKVFVQYRNGLPLVWVQADAKPTKATAE